MQIKQLLAEYKDIFQTSNSPRGQYSGIKHEIHTGNHPRLDHDHTEILRICRQKLEDMYKICCNKVLLESQPVAGVFQFALFQK